jgi:Na+-transporting NADH:ubiquinone oxidoreductase subunit NqrC
MNLKFTEMADRLMELPQAISEIQLEILERTEASKEVQDKITTIESKIKTDINNVVDANGKKVYSNAEAREAAFIEDANENEELKDLKTDYDYMQREISEKRIEIEKLSNDQRNIRSLLNFFANNSENANQF